MPRSEHPPVPLGNVAQLAGPPPCRSGWWLGSQSLWHLFAITLLALVLRLAFLDGRGLWYDEGCTIYLSEYAARFSRLFNPDYNNDPPLFLLLIYWWRRVLEGVPLRPGGFWYDYILRFVPLAFSVATVPLTFLAGRAVFLLARTETRHDVPERPAGADDGPALFGALLVAVSPFQVYYSHELRNYSLFAFFGALSLWLFARALNNNKTGSWALLALALTLAFWNHFIAAWFFITIDAFLLLTWKTHKRHIWRWAPWHVLAGLACLPPLYTAYHTAAVVGQINMQWIPPPDIKTPLITFKTFFAGYSPAAWAYWPLFLAGALLCCLGAWRLRRSWRTLALLVLWTALAMLASAVIWRLRTFSYYEVRLFIWAHIPAALLAGVGWTCLTQKLRWSVLAVLLLLTAPLLADTYAHRIHPVPHHRLGVRHKAENRPAASYLAARTAPEEPIFHASHITLPSFRMYLPEHHNQHVCLDETNVAGFISAYPNEPLWRHLDFLPVPVGELDLAVPAFWLVISWWEPFDPPQLLADLEGWFQERFTETSRHEFFALTLIRFENTPAQTAD